jgi:hypothetical protein
MATVHPYIRDIERQQRMLAPVLALVNSPDFEMVRRQYVELRRYTETYRIARSMMETQRAFLRTLPADVQDAIGVRLDYGPERWTEEYDAEGTADTEAAEEDETFGWTSRFREAMSQPELTEQEKHDLIASMILAMAVLLFVISLQHPQVGDRIQLADSLIGIGLLVFAFHKLSK